MTFAELLAIASGEKCEGEFRCVFCGAQASREYQLPSSFTTRDTLAVPNGKHICNGCILSTQESGEATYHTGEVYQYTKAFRRMCSWVVTRKQAIAATKGHIEYLRGVCLNPPEPPFGISIAVSGQKHVIYRGVVCHSQHDISLTLEGETISYKPSDLQKRLELCGKLAASTGKPALSETPSASFWIRVCDRFANGEELCTEWEQVMNEPLSRLAVFLCPKKEDCESAYPSDRPAPIPVAGRGVDRPDKKANRGSRNSKRQKPGCGSLFGDV
jgi:CRISPR type IV-associated protein Csf1